MSKKKHQQPNTRGGVQPTPSQATTPQAPKQPQTTTQPTQPNTNQQTQTKTEPADRDRNILDSVKKLKYLKEYNIRVLVEDAEQFGPELKQKKVETNQIRKFLDAINRLKVKIAREKGEDNSSQKIFEAIETDIVLLKPKLAYAAARQAAIKPLSNVMAEAIDRVRDLEDFQRLVQLIESIIAYHKAEGGK